MNSRGIIVASLLAAVLLLGCAINQSQRAAQHLGAITANAEGIKADTKAARPYTKPEGASRLDSIDHKADAITKDAKAAQTAVTQASSQNQKLRDQYTALNNSFPVWAWRWLVRWFWIIGIGFVVVGGAAAYLSTLAGPVGIVAKEVMAALPLMNPFRWGAKLLEKRAAGRAAA